MMLIWILLVRTLVIGWYALYGNHPVPPGTTVVCAYVPRARLAEAIAGPAEAIALQAQWNRQVRQEAAAEPGVHARPRDSMIVVFLHTPPGLVLRGRLAVPNPHGGDPYLLPVNSGSSGDALYVIDGGGGRWRGDLPPRDQACRWEWLHVDW